MNPRSLGICKAVNDERVRRTSHAALLAAAIIAVVSSPAVAQGNDEELARQLANPVASLISVPLQFNWDENFGPLEDGKRFQFNLQPVIPFRLNQDWNLITRTILPVHIDLDNIPSGTSGISAGVNNFNGWGVLLASALAPFSVLGASPALMMVVAGAITVQLFVAWAQRRQARAQTPLLALEVIQSAPDRAAVILLMSIVMLGNALTFLVPLYIQMVQGRTSFDTALAMIPYQVAVMAAAIFVLSLYDSLTPRQIARYAFVLVSGALVLLGVAINNEWHNLLVVLGLVMFGLGQGALVTQLFSVLVTSAPPRCVGDVGSLRGTTRNLAAGVGTAVGGALVVAILSVNIERSLADNPNIPPELIKQVDLDRATFVSNERLKDVMARTTATPVQIDEAVRINADARLRALKLSFLLLAGVALLAIVPAGRLPG